MREKKESWIFLSKNYADGNDLESRVVDLYKQTGGSVAYLLSSTAGEASVPVECIQSAEDEAWTREQAQMKSRGDGRPPSLLLLVVWG